MKKNDKVYVNIIALTFVQFANYLAPLLVLPYLSRTLGVEGFGLVVISLSIIAVCYIVTDFGFNLSAPNWIVHHKNSRDSISTYISSIFILKILLLLPILLFIFLYFTFISNISSHNIEMMWACMFAVAAQAFIPVWFFQGIERMRLITVFWVIAKIVYLVLVLSLVKKQGQESLVIFCLGISNLLATGIAILFIYKSGYCLGKTSVANIINALRESFLFFLSRAAVGLYTSASTFIVGSYAGVPQAALYSSAEKLYQAGQSLTSPISQALYPYLSRSGDAKTFFKFLSLFLLPICLGAGICYIFAEYIMVLFYGADFSQAFHLLRVFLICSVINFIGVNFGYPAFSIIHRLDLANKSVIIASVFYFILLAFLVVTNNVTSLKVAMGVTCVEFIVMLMRITWFFKEFNKYKRAKV